MEVVFGPLFARRMDYIESMSEELRSTVCEI